MELLPVSLHPLFWKMRYFGLALGSPVLVLGWPSVYEAAPGDMPFTHS